MVTGDSDNEFDNVGETPAEPPTDPSAEGESRPSQARKRFRAWSSAQQEESEPGLLSKLGKRISGIFTKPAAASPEPEVEPSSDLELIMPEPMEPAPPAVAERVNEMPAADDRMEIDLSAQEPPAAFDVVPESEPIAAADVVPEVVEQPKRPSLLSRLFGRKPKDEAPSADAFEDAGEEAPPIDSFAVEKDDASELQATAPDEEPLIAATEQAGDAIVAEAPEELAAAEPTPDAPYVEQPTEPMAPPPFEEPTTAPIPESRGLFGRFFSRKPKVSRPIPKEVESSEFRVPSSEESSEFRVPSSEQDALGTPVPELATRNSELEAPDSDLAAPFSSVEDALPAEPPPSTVDLIEAALAEPIVEEEKKPGFFSRLFGRKSRSEPRPSLEIEVHEDRIEAAAHALDEVSGEHFAGTPAEGSESFASVEDALPESSGLRVPGSEQDQVAAPELEASEPATRNSELATRNSELATRNSELATQNSELVIQPFDPFAETLDPDRRTVETTPPDSRSTIEVEQREERSPEELELEAELGLHREPGDADEIPEKTDEFAIPSVDPEATTGEIIETDTTQVAKVTWWMRLLGRKPKDEAKPGLPAGATVVEGNPNFLFTKFKAFYNEIIRLKHQKTEFAAGFSTAILTDFHADVSPEGAAAAQSEQLKMMLELQAAEAQWMGGEAKDRYPDAQYAMACMADELFTHMEWDGQSAWKNHLLEVKLFRTRAADVELFKRIDKLLKEQPNSHVARDLARVYLLVLAAGFQGKYRPFGLPRALAQYRQRLYEYIHQGDSLMLYAPDRKIFPDAASRTLEGHAVGRFSSLQRWAAILIFMVLGYTVLAHYAWNRVSADLKDVTERIRAASSTSGATTSPSSSNSTAASGGGGR